MKTVKPRVYLVGRMAADFVEINRFLEDHNVPEWTTDTANSEQLLPEVAGRLCYMSFDKPRPGGNKAYLGHILEVGHGSVLEHAVWGFIIVGVSRTFSHELVRHRIGWSYSQLSQRYVDESVAEYVEPDIIACDTQLHEIWRQTVQHSHDAYVKLAAALRDKLAATCCKCNQYMSGSTCDRCGSGPLAGTELRKAARQAARSVLPNATETKIYCTANARSIRHVLEMRASRHAEVEIRSVAMMMYKIMVADAPNIFGDYKPVELADGSQELQTAHRKV